MNQDDTTESIYMKAEISNLKYNTISDTESSNEQYSNDNMVNTNITLYPKGSFSTRQHWHTNSNDINTSNPSNLALNRGGGGDAYYTKGSSVVISSQVSVGIANDEPLKRRVERNLAKVNISGVKSEEAYYIIDAQNDYSEKSTYEHNSRDRILEMNKRLNDVIEGRF